MSTTPEPARPVLLFDGECGLCNRVVRFLLRLDRHGRLRFAPLQGPAAQEFLRTHGLPAEDFSTLVFVPDWTPSTSSGQGRREDPQFFLRTDGAIAALRACGGTGCLFAVLLAIVPRGLRDAGYKFVARTRYRIFGPWKACPLPRPEWAARFLE
ncbi:MAG TPA: DCC1-like thiol-disulfide oxidoreductase family protein [Opitutaceae bacterium]|nr:DCC1-like thiol-disulfide oxidoreductase family protein [Opitutaceae bacterium]